MQNAIINTPAIIAAIETATPAKTPKAPKAAAPAAPTAKQAAIASHNAAGYTGNLYTGLSATRNAGIAKAADTTTSKAKTRTFAQLTPRMQSALTELSKAYAGATFPLCGIDRGQAAIFINSGFFIGVTATHAKLSAETIKRFAPTKATPAK